MSRVIGNKELKQISDAELRKITINQGVIFYMYNGEMIEFRVKDLIVSNTGIAIFIDYTGLKVFRQNIERIEIL